MTAFEAVFLFNRLISKIRSDLSLTILPVIATLKIEFKEAKMGTTYRLILQSGEGAGTEYPLEKTELLLGRDLSNDIVVNDPEVSRRHARLILQAGTYILEDLGSTNGTFIRGQRLAAPVVLRPGETITIGEKVILKYEVLVSDPNATVVVQRGTRQPAVAVVPSMPTTPPITPVQTPVSIPPPAQVQPPVQPAAFQQQISGTPAYIAPPKKKSKALLIILILLAIFIVFCVIPWIILEVTNSYCAILPGVFNSLQPGACP
jgi:hypothetical protein